MKLVKKLKKSVLLEQDDGYRFYVPNEVYEDVELGEGDYLENGIPYSLSFDLILSELFDPKEVQKSLYSNSIHTLDDVLNNRKRVNDILKHSLTAEDIIKSVK